MLRECVETGLLSKPRGSWAGMLGCYLRHGHRSLGFSPPIRTLHRTQYLGCKCSQLYLCLQNSEPGLSLPRHGATLQSAVSGLQPGLKQDALVEAVCKMPGCGKTRPCKLSSGLMIRGHHFQTSRVEGSADSRQGPGKREFCAQQF